MVEIQALAQRGGNSMAVVIPAEVVEKQKIVENEQLIIKVEKKRPLAGVLLGLGKGKITRSTQEIKDELRAGWTSATDRKQEEEWKKEILYEITN